MKKLLSFLAVVFLVGQTWAQTTEYLQQKDFQVEKKKIYESINASKKQLSEIKKADAKIIQSIDSIKQTQKSNAVQLLSNSDSLTKTNARVNSLQDQFDGQKSLSRGFLILLFIILFILFIIVLILLFRFTKKAELTRLAIIDLDKKTSERLETEIKSLKSDIQAVRDQISDVSREMNQRMASGLNSLETRSNQLDQQLQESLAATTGKFGFIAQEIGKLKEEQSDNVKTLTDKHNALVQDAGQWKQVLATQVAKLEEEMRGIKMDIALKIKNPVIK